ncbi:transposase [Aliiglaciecola sp. LCG003]|uniref:transposase n=1 Tax=Aliiglaciecola sp. LCG003 TaxID=3053655 RepID=UPI0025731220|nr:transposase [Aliiglaciecola sp. LCG003]WJG11152.1 transposase [Aliiglaciecola sp. LCG003]
MPMARKHQISLSDTAYYHCVSRCVRRAFLCGEDKLTGQSYEHRRSWVEDRLLFLSTVFTINVCAYAVMSNHTHVVLHVNREKAFGLTDIEIVKRWQKIHKSTLLAQRFTAKQSTPLTQAEQITLNATIAIYRQRLYDISWFMRELNEVIARKANTEDCCTGHFWEGRFKSQALLDEQALTACMVYVDLNPIRAKIADSLETSEHTSIKRRISHAERGRQPKVLMPFVGGSQQHQSPGLALNLLEYIQLVELTGQSLAPNERGSIAADTTPILTKLGIEKEQWQILTQCFESTFSVAAGTVDSINRYRAHTKRKREIPIQISV